MRKAPVPTPITHSKKSTARMCWASQPTLPPPRVLYSLFFALCACEPQEEPAPTDTPERYVPYAGLATVVNFSTGRLPYPLAQPPRTVRFVFRHYEKSSRVEIPQQCEFPVSQSERGLLANGEPCLFDNRSVLSAAGIRSRTVKFFRYSSTLLQLELVGKNEQHVQAGHYAPNYDIVQGVAHWKESAGLSKPPQTTGYEYREGAFTLYERRALDDSSECGRPIFQDTGASGFLIETEKGHVSLQGWGCSTQLRGTAPEPAACEYLLQLPADVPRLWLTQFELEEGLHTMRGELHGSDYKYCIEIEAQNVTPL